MPKSLSCLLAFTMLLSTAGTASAANGTAGDDRTMRIAIGEWPPFVSEELEHYGLAARIVTEAFAVSGIDVEYRFYPWKRAYRDTTQGYQDATAIWTRTPEREDEVLFSEPVLIAEKVFFHLEGTDFDWNGMEDLAHFRVGATRGYGYGDAFDTAVEDGTIPAEYVDSDKQNFAKLLHDRIDVFPMTKAVGYFILNTEFDSGEAAAVTHDPKVVQQAVFHLLFSRSVDKNERMIEIFNHGLEQLREEGKIERYVRQSQQGQYIRSE